MGQGSRCKYLKKSHGQISVLIVLSLIPLFTLFAFVVNVGMLVNAKISLQNAADLAAYAGAATQARQMTHVSHLNYEMRQAYKKLIFKLYVVGSLSLKCFPRGGGYPQECGNPPDNSFFDFINPGGQFPKTPVVCLTLSQDSNPCQLPEAVPIVEAPACIPLDPVCGALGQAAKAIQEIQKKSCSANTIINQEVVAHWLYAANQDSQINSQPALAGLIQGLGLVTENLLLRERIQTVTDYINEAPKEGLTLERVNGELAQIPDQAKVERSILAFQTANQNLNENVFSEITMDELTPRSQMLKLREIKPYIQVPYVKMEGSSNECKMTLQYIEANPIVGVVKEGESLVYYAVKLTAKAKLLFNPFPFGHANPEGVQLTAYAAAYPFGSRIGPDLTEADFVKNFQLDSKTQFPIPYLFLAGGGAGRGGNNEESITYQHRNVLRSFHTILAGQGTVSGGTINTDAYRRALRAATVPDEFERGRYNIPVDVDSVDDATSSGMFSYYKGGGDRYTFWAPIESPPGNGLTQLREKIKESIGTLSPSATKNFGGSEDQVKSTLSGIFINKLQALFETDLANQRNIYRMPDPTGEHFFQGPLSPIPGKIFASQKLLLATSFTTHYDKNYYERGRDGYSVKYIPFKMLMSEPGVLRNDGTRWISVSNELNKDKDDLLKLAH